MAYSSVNIAVPAGDAVADWVLVATNPVYLKIQNRCGCKWQLAVTTAGVPLETTGFLMFDPSNKEHESTFEQLWPAATAALFYIRAPQQKGLQDTPIFGVLRDQ